MSLSSVRRTLLAALLLSLTACTSHTAKNDADTVVPDGDVPVVDDAAVIDQDNTAPTDDVADISDIIIGDEDFSDEDVFVSDHDYTYPSGTKGDPDCPYLDEAPFPYVDAAGKKHFCRKCDTPTASDPQCVRNLWEMRNREMHEKYPDKECYPFPCELDMVPRTPPEDSTNLMNCDLIVSNNGWGGDPHDMQQYGAYQSAVGMWGLNWATEENPTRVMEYRINTKSFWEIGSSSTNPMFANNRYVFMSGNTKDLRSYVISALKEGEKYTYEMIYTDDANRIYMSYIPAIGGKWVLLNIKHLSSQTYEFLYARIGEWKWTKLGDGDAFFPSIEGDYLVFSANSTSGIWLCDLSKAPQDYLKDCKLLNKPNETAFFAAIDRQNPNRIAYGTQGATRTIMLAETSGDSITYTNLNITPITPLEKFIGFSAEQLEGNLLLYEEGIIMNEDGDTDNRACFYRLDLKKSYCLKPVAENVRIEHTYPAFDLMTHTFLWKPGTPLFLRDMDCYCLEYSDVCPFEQ